MTEPPGDDGELARWVEAYELHIRGGGATSPRRWLATGDAADWAARHPEEAAELVELLTGVHLLERTGAALGSVTAASRQAAELPTAIGKHRILKELGRGGMGVVYLAHDDELNRLVAVKVLSAGLTGDATFTRRLEREAEAIARLSHPSIVPLFEVGQAGDVPYYAMHYVDGPGLDLVLRRARFEAEGSAPGGGSTDLERFVHGLQQLQTSPDGAEVPITPRVAARIIAQAASALAHAHGRGVLHRDVKPGNLMFDLDGHAWVNDFGLCRIGEQSALTRTGDVVGTLRYMAPEQLEGRSDERSDVYSLGLVLYELLAGRPAFPQARRAELVARIAHAEPTPLRKVRARLPRALEVVAQKASAKSPEQRYPSAQALASDLEAFLEGRPVEARPPSAWYLLRLFAARHRAGVAAFAVAALLLAAMAVKYVMDIRAREASLSRSDYVAALGAAEVSNSQGAGARARRFLDAAPARERGFEWAHLDAKIDQTLWTTSVGRDLVATLAPSADGALLAVVSAPRCVLVDAATGEELAVIDPARSQDALRANTACWSADGEHLHVFDRQGRERRFRVVREGGEVRLEPSGPLRAGVAPPDAHGVVHLGQDRFLGTAFPGIVKLWSGAEDGAPSEIRDASAGVVGFVLRDGSGPASRGLAIDRAGHSFIAEGSSLRRVPGPRSSRRLAHVSCSGDGETLLLSWFDGHGELRDNPLRAPSTTAPPRRALRVGERVRRTALSHDGELVAVADQQRNLRVMRTREPTRSTKLGGAVARATSLTFSPDGRRLYLGDELGNLCAWDVAARGGEASFFGHLGDVWCADISHDGRLAVTGGREGWVIVWDLVREEALCRFARFSGGISSVVFEDGGHGALAIDADGTAVLLDPVSGEVRGSRELEARFAKATAIPGGFAVACRDRVLWLDGDLGEQRAATPTSLAAPLADIALDVRTRRVVVVDRERAMEAFGLDDAAAIFTTPPRGGGDSWVHLDLSPESGLIAISVAGASVEVHDLADGRHLRSLPIGSDEAGEERVHDVCFGDGGTRLFCVTRQGRISVHDPVRGGHLVDIDAHEGWGTVACFHGPTMTLLTCPTSQTVKAWSTMPTAGKLARRAGSEPLRPPEALHAAQASLTATGLVEESWSSLTTADPDVWRSLHVAVGEAARRPPSHPGWFELEGAVWTRLGRLDRAEAAYASSPGPSVAGPHRQVARAFRALLAWQCGRYPEAARHLAAVDDGHARMAFARLARETPGVRAFLGAAQSIRARTILR